MTTPRILIACIGNIFLGDDGFGVEVVRRMAARKLPPGVSVADFGIRIDRRPENIAVLPQPDCDVLLRDHQHAAGAAARVVDGGHHPMAPDSVFVADEH